MVQQESLETLETIRFPHQIQHGIGEFGTVTHSISERDRSYTRSDGTEIKINNHFVLAEHGFDGGRSLWTIKLGHPLQISLQPIESSMTGFSVNLRASKCLGLTCARNRPGVYLKYSLASTIVTRNLFCMRRETPAEKQAPVEVSHQEGAGDGGGQRKQGESLDPNGHAQHHTPAQHQHSLTPSPTIQINTEEVQ